MAGSLQTLTFHRAFTTHNHVSLHLRPNHPSYLLQYASNSIVYSPDNVSLHQNPRSISHISKASSDSNQVGDNGNQQSKSWESSKGITWTQPLLKFAATNFLPIALVSGVALGLVNPSLGCLAHRYSMSKFSTFGIFLISGLTLRTEEIGAAAEAWPTGLFGLISILLLSPFFSKLILHLQLAPQEFVTGLAIFSCMPTTLSSGVALTQLVGGNSALALAMTVISNLLGILIVPFSLSKFIANGVGVSVPTEQLLRSLLITLLIPLVLGKVFRDFFGGVAKYVDQNRKLFSMSSAILLSLVPWIQVSKSRPLLLMVKPTMFLVAAGMGMLLHIILLACNTLAAQSFSVTFGKNSSFSKKKNFRALVIVASQKTLPVMVAVVEQLHGALGESGLLVLPCVASHIIQIILDSFLVNFWLQKDQVIKGNMKTERDEA